MSVKFSMPKLLLLNHFIACEYHNPSPYSIVPVSFDTSNAFHVIIKVGMVSIWLMRLANWNSDFTIMGYMANSAQMISFG